MQYVVRGCFNIHNKLCSDEDCRLKNDCLLKKVADKLLKVVREDTCSRCDGCGYDAENGCQDSSCGTYQAYECLELLGIEE